MVKMDGNNFIFFLTICVLSWRMELLKAQMVPAVYVFGDSLVDVGNNNFLPVSFAKANFPHNGVDFPTRKPTGRFCNGKNAADLLAEKLGLPSSPPYLSLSVNNITSHLTGASFASGGAGIFNSTDHVFGQAIPLSNQVDDFVSLNKILMKLGSSAAQNHTSKSLFAFVIGSNDLFDYFGSPNLRKQNTPQQYVDLMVTTLKQQLMRLYAVGARRFFLGGVGAIGCIPVERVKNKSHGCNAEHNFWAVEYNDGLKAMLNELKSKLRGFYYSFFDTYGIMQTITQNASTYGFNEVEAACCGLGELRAIVPCLPFVTQCSNRTDHMFWDLYHPTEATTGIVVDTLFDGPSRYCVPINVRQLVSG
ncbi:hypothetical protein ES332_D05G437200v1 [Gossypium tomentosum]|uniref:SGNH hydrolase-type esterase domain-containing protein n=1 Tax=Gossypium tomentosum TaxID=34277 RepID=A0A5D2L797_GOSTO|nr:hypothetical protein ES332_D05G437200v1 [Gossypium tomentosum]